MSNMNESGHHSRLPGPFFGSARGVAESTWREAGGRWATEVQATTMRCAATQELAVILDW